MMNMAAAATAIGSAAIEFLAEDDDRLADFEIYMLQKSGGLDVRPDITFRQVMNQTRDHLAHLFRVFEGDSE